MGLADCELLLVVGALLHNPGNCPWLLEFVWVLGRSQGFDLFKFVLFFLEILVLDHSPGYLGQMLLICCYLLRYLKLNSCFRESPSSLFG